LNRLRNKTRWIPKRRKGLSFRRSLRFLGTLTRNSSLQPVDTLVVGGSLKYPGTLFKLRLALRVRYSHRPRLAHQSHPTRADVNKNRGSPGKPGRLARTARDRDWQYRSRNKASSIPQGRASSKSDKVGGPPIATTVCGVPEFRDVPIGDAPGGQGWPVSDYGKTALQSVYHQLVESLRGSILGLVARDRQRANAVEAVTWMEMMASTDERAQLMKVSRQVDRLNNPCQLCRKRGVSAPNVHFASNFGIGFTRFESHLSGDFCAVCIHKKFVIFTLINLVGWFGIVSMIKAPYFLLSNLSEYEWALRFILRKRKQRIAAVNELLEKSSRPN
jgi:hypothetical protein